MTYYEYLSHHGIKGQKWGVRRFQNDDGSLTRAGKLREMKDEYKKTKKAYNEAGNYAFNNNTEGNWDKATKARANMDAAKAKYKAEKQRMKADRKSKYKEIQSNTSIGQKLLYNNATRKRAAKYVVDNNMSLADATKKAKGDAKRNTAILLATYGAMAIGAVALTK